jgi:hypothetical protein
MTIDNSDGGSLTINMAEAGEVWTELVSVEAQCS